jgi:hypothetical protein
VNGSWNQRYIRGIQDERCLLTICSRQSLASRCQLRIKLLLWRPSDGRSSGRETNSKPSLVSNDSSGPVRTYWEADLIANSLMG